MGENKTEKRYTGCACRCGQPTWNTYRPGHDAKHVSQWVRLVICETESPWDRGQAWQAALRDLPTEALRRKFRTTMYRSAQRHLGYTIDQMDDGEWQRVIHLKALLARDDAEMFSRPTGFGSLVLATYAAALGWTRHAVNVKHS